MNDTSKRALWTAAQAGAAAFLVIFVPGAVGILNDVAEAVSNRATVDLPAKAAAVLGLVVAGAAAGLAAAFSVFKNKLLKPGHPAR